jgi:hypothetical protein
VLPDEVGRRPAHWIVRQARRVVRARYDAQIDQVRNTELGTIRALASAFGTKRLPDLPTFDEIVRRRAPRETRLPAWMVEFERVNADRRVR